VVTGDLGRGVGAVVADDDDLVGNPGLGPQRAHGRGNALRLVMSGEQRNDLEVHALTIGTVIYASGSY
jgi:hypothetical protein